MRAIRAQLHHLVSIIIPPPAWRVPVIIASAVLFGAGAVVMHVANATSYLSDQPEACMNCHVMAPQYATWQRGSHARVAVCNDCHVPHDNAVVKYAFKAMDGLRHSAMFTFRLEPQVIHVKEAGIGAIQGNCVRCHRSVLQNTDMLLKTGSEAQHGEGRLCWDCHRETPHGRVNGLASVPNARVPRPSSVIPEWINRVLESSSK
ncbi:MAG: cytochrome c nitrite reductase small subunit [Acidobacteriota bacterium]